MSCDWACPYLGSYVNEYWKGVLEASKDVSLLQQVVHYIIIAVSAYNTGCTWTGHIRAGGGSSRWNVTLLEDELALAMQMTLSSCVPEPSMAGSATYSSLPA